MYINELTFDENKKFSAAIKKGYISKGGMNSEWRNSFVGAFVMKYPNAINCLDVLRNLLGRMPQWEDLTDELLRDYKYEVSKNSANTCVYKYSVIKAVLNDYRLEKPIPAVQYNRVLKGKKEPFQTVFLTREEISFLDLYDPTTEIERYVKKIFMIECLTGARNCDAREMTLDNLNIDTNQITYVSKKTKTEVSLKVDRMLKPYLSDNISLDLCRSSVNRVIRHICKECCFDTKVKLYQKGTYRTGKKWEFVTSHTGRRSFATNLYLWGVSPDIIANFMGHASPETTMKSYILCKRETDDNANAYFNS